MVFPWFSMVSMVFHGFHGFPMVSYGFPMVFNGCGASQAGAPAASLRPARPLRFDPTAGVVGGRGGRVAGRAACHGDPGGGTVGGDKPWENHGKSIGKWWFNGIMNGWGRYFLVTDIGKNHPIENAS